MFLSNAMRPKQFLPKKHRPNVGKYVYGALYVHHEALTYLDTLNRKKITNAEKLVGNHAEAWNVVKLEDARPHRVAFLTYESFREVAFPALLESVSIDLEKKQVIKRNFRHSKNPPILHRKELLLPPDHPDRSRFAMFTSEIEALGLFKNSQRIGFKTLWEERLCTHGLTIIGHEIVKIKSTGENATSIERHRTAIARDRLSAPWEPETIWLSMEPSNRHCP